MGAYPAATNAAVIVALLNVIPGAATVVWRCMAAAPSQHQMPHRPDDNWRQLILIVGMLLALVLLGSVPYTRCKRGSNYCPQP